jgi:poly(A) polymerase/tRNA nucleotidyltransferase (CCA-adding enzyme)
LRALLALPALVPVLDALPAARLVGGCVRDSVAGRAIADIDLATPDPPETVLRVLQAAGIRAVPTGLAHGTVTAISQGQGFEITTLRRDVETDGRHARVAWTDDWQQDAARRDFTINAMSMDRSGQVFDYFGGQADLKAGRVRFVGEPATRLREDRLRVLRFFRFQARYGTGPADPAALLAITAAADHLGTLSAERIWHELRRILAAPDPVDAVRLMQQTRVLAAILPEGADPARLARLIAIQAPNDPILRLAALLPPSLTRQDALAFVTRLRLSNADRDLLLTLRAGALPAADAGDTVLRQALADDPANVLAGRAWLAGYDLQTQLQGMKRPVFPLEGRDVVALGVPPGPEVGRWLRRLRQWWWDCGCLPDAAACRAELARHLARNRAE